VTPDLERDLAAFERNELSREQLLAHHAEAEPLIRLHDRMKLAATAPDPDAVAGWATLLEKMDAAAVVVPFRRPSRTRRTTVLAVAAALMLAGSAFAAVGPRALRERTPITPPSPAPIAVPTPPETGGSPEAPEPTDGHTRSSEPSVHPTPGGSNGQSGSQQGGDQTPSSGPTATQSGGDSQGQDQSGGDSQGQDQRGGDSQGQDQSGGDSQGGDRTPVSDGDQSDQGSQGDGG